MRGVPLVRTRARRGAPPFSPLSHGAHRKHQVYFRFYDPRVLRVFLSNCSDSERHEFWGDIAGFVVELPGAEGARLFERGSDGALLRTTVALVDAPDAIVSS